MPKFCSLLSILLLLLCGLGPIGAQEGLSTQGISSYLQQAKQTDDSMIEVAARMKAEMADLQQRIETGNFDPAAINQRFRDYQREMQQVSAGFESLQIPSEAKAHHQLLLQHFQIGIVMMDELVPMMQAAGNISKLSERLDAEPENEESIRTDMNAQLSIVEQHQAKVLELAEQGRILREQADAERLALLEKFGIE